ncbi:hypothetical protein DXB92_06965 [Ruminococcus sp. OM06-36AC]|nr:hypothetical protein DXB92_06965 [Ruminococcus sp. OM06-36AC]
MQVLSQILCRESISLVSRCTVRKNTGSFREYILSRTSMANWIIRGAEWFRPVIDMLWKYAYLEPVLNADETSTRVLKKDGKPTKKKGQMWIVCTGASASKKNIP